MSQYKIRDRQLVWNLGRKVNLGRIAQNDTVLTYADLEEEDLLIKDKEYELAQYRKALYREVYKCD